MMWVRRAWLAGGWVNPSSPAPHGKIPAQPSVQSPLTRLGEGVKVVRWRSHGGLLAGLKRDKSIG